MKLRPGTTFGLADVSKDANGYMLRQHLRVGTKAKRIGKVKRFKREEDLLIEIERLVQDRLAQLGREKTEK